MNRFPIRLGSRSSNKDVLDFIRTFCPWAVDWKWWYRQVIYLDPARRVFTADADGSQVLTLNTLFPNNVFPENVDKREGARLKLLVPPSGGDITDVDVTLGGTFENGGADPDGLVTITAIEEGTATAGYIVTPSAARYAREYESAFSPTLTITTTGGNIADIEEGALEVLIPWSPLRSV